MAFQAALLLAAGLQLAFGLNDLIVKLGVTLLAVSQLHVQLFEAGFSGNAAFLQLVQLRINFCRVGRQLLASGTGLFGQLG